MNVFESLANMRIPVVGFGCRWYTFEYIDLCSRYHDHRGRDSRTRSLKGPDKDGTEIETGIGTDTLLLDCRVLSKTLAKRKKSLGSQ